MATHPVLVSRATRPMSELSAEPVNPRRRSTLHALFATPDDGVATWMRLMLGLVFFPHGMQKLFGWFGGEGFSATLASSTDKMHIPMPLAVLAILTESLGSIALLLGLFTRVAAFGIAVVMAVAIAMVHWQNGFFMNWSGKQNGEGFEYHLLAIALAIAVMVRGAGATSIDRKIAEKIS
jgi:putative oxidoreductase